TPRKPILGSFVGCCASATAPPTTSTRAIIRRPNHFGFWIADFRLSDRNQRNAGRDVLVMSWFPIQNPKSKIQNSSDHLVRSVQQRLRNRHADQLCCLKVDNKLEFRWLLDR